MVQRILIFIVLLAALWAWPAGRAKVGHVLHPLFAKLGPVGEKIETPMKKYTAKTQVSAIVNGIEHAREEGKDLPDARTFTRWLRAHPLFDTKDTDPWGRTYYMKGENRVFIVGSRGPDGVMGNTDDISSTVTF